MDRIRGVSSYGLSRLVIGDFCFFLVAAVGVMVQLFNRPDNPPSSYFVVFFCILGACLLTGLMIALLVPAMVWLGGRELRQGYTYAGQANVNAAQLDPRSGVVIREPGEPFLDSAELKARTLAARQWARGERV